MSYISPRDLMLAMKRAKVIEFNELKNITDKALRNQLASAMHEGITFTQNEVDIIQQLTNGQITIEEAMKKIFEKDTFYT